MLSFKYHRGLASAIVFASASGSVLADYDGGASRASCTQTRVARTAAEEAKISSAEIVFYGDSRMESTCYGYQTDVVKVYATTLPQAVAKELGIGGPNNPSGYTKILDRARDGTSTANLNHSGYLPLWNRTSYLTNGAGGSKTSANVVVLAYGTNDVWYDIKEGTLPAFPERLRDMATSALQDGKSVVLATPYKVCSFFDLLPASLSNQQSIDLLVSQYVSHINQVYIDLNASYSGRVAVAALHNLPWFDCSRASPQTVDGLHATQSSIIKMAKVLADAVASVSPSGPFVSADVSTPSLVYGTYQQATFRWAARSAISVSVHCSGAVAGSYTGAALKDAIYITPVSHGEGTCTVTARNSAGKTAVQSQTVTVQSPAPTISTTINKTNLVVGDNRSAVFSWIAADAGTVSISCTGAVTGAYSGSSLSNAIYVEPISAGSGTCKATAYGAGGRTAESSKSVSVQSDAPEIFSSADSTAIAMGGTPTIFRWNATNATSVSVACSGSVSGNYSGNSLQNAIYVHPVSLGSGVCSATATNSMGRTAETRMTIVVQR